MAGYQLDPAAQIDIYVDLRFKWFDYVLRGGPKPVILQDKVNYQVTGANTWKHAPSLSAMGVRALKFYLSSARSSDAYRLNQARPPRDASIALSVNLADRSEVSYRFTNQYGGETTQNWFPPREYRIGIGYKF